jgi:hypothetical protein
MAWLSSPQKTASSKRLKPRPKAELVKSAIQEAGSLKQHYEILVSDCLNALRKCLLQGLGYQPAFDRCREQTAKANANATNNTT